jgi:bifunctional non-homologous end joining protein LigD
MLATPGPLPAPPDDEAWAFEMKWDGMRAIAEVTPEGWRLVGRSGKDATSSYPDLAGPFGLGDLSARLGGRALVLDGEIVATDDRGVPSFERLQQRMNVGRPTPELIATVPVAYVVFDVLQIDDTPALDLPYRDRRRLLDALDLASSPDEGSRIQVSPVIEGDAEQAWAMAEAMDLEGVVAKRLDCPYLPGKRATGWRKVKRIKEREVIVVGWVEGEGRRSGGVGALVIAVPEGPVGQADRPLLHAGRVGTGFTDAMLDHLREVLSPLSRDAPPVVDPPGGAAGRAIHWVEPELVGEVTYTEWTTANNLRHPVWRGLRSDKEPAEVEPR